MDPGKNPSDPNKGNDDKDKDKDKNDNTDAEMNSRNGITVIKNDKTKLEPIKEIQNSATALASS